jgi:hypothetical protein
LKNASLWGWMDLKLWKCSFFNFQGWSFIHFDLKLWIVVWFLCEVTSIVLQGPYVTSLLMHLKVASLGKEHFISKKFLPGRQGCYLVSVGAWAISNLFWNTSKKYWKNIPLHIAHNISWCGGIFYHMYMDEQ